MLFISLLNLYSEPTVFIGTVNDNLFNLPDLPLDSVLGGPDDRYTFSFFVNYSEENWKLLTHYHAITLREENYRYDFLYLLYNHNWMDEYLSYSLGIGLEGIGDFGSAYLQNSIHKVLNFHELDLPYLDYNFGLIAVGSVEMVFLSLFNDNLTVSGNLELELTTSRIPDALTFTVPVIFSSDVLMAEVSTGVDIKFTIVNESLSGNSFFYKTLLGIRFAENFILNLGFSRNFIYYNPYFISFTEYEKHSDTFQEGVSILNVPQFYIGVSVCSAFPEIQDLPLP